MITASDASIRAGNRWLLRGASLHLAPGTLTAVLGPNGAGKTTLLRALNGERATDAGRVLLDGIPIAAMPQLQLARRRAVFSQDQSLAFGLTVEDVVALGRLPHRGTPAECYDRRALAAMRENFALETLWQRQFPSLSGGERQRTQLARAAAQLWRPDGAQHGQILFLDEPAAALDLAQQRRALRFAIDMAASGAIVLAVLHDPNHAVHADQIILLHDGRIMASGPPEAVLTSDHLSACFGMPVETVSRPDGPPIFLAA